MWGISGRRGRGCRGVKVTGHVRVRMRKRTAVLLLVERSAPTNALMLVREQPMLHRTRRMNGVDVGAVAYRGWPRRATNEFDQRIYMELIGMRQVPAPITVTRRSRCKRWWLSGSDQLTQAQPKALLFSQSQTHYRAISIRGICATVLLLISVWPALDEDVNRSTMLSLDSFLCWAQRQRQLQQSESSK